MAHGFEFRLPGFDKPLESPEFYLSGAMRAFARTAQELGVAQDRLALRLADNPQGGDPLYEISLLDRSQGRVWNPDHALYFGDNDADRLLEEDALQDNRYGLDDLQTWLNRVNGMVPDEQTDHAPLRRPGATA